MMSRQSEHGIEIARTMDSSFSALARSPHRTKAAATALADNPRVSRKDTSDIAPIGLRFGLPVDRRQRLPKLYRSTEVLVHLGISGLRRLPGGQKTHKPRNRNALFQAVSHR